MREPETTYRVAAEVWNEDKAEREAEAYEFKWLKIYKTEKAARNFFDKFPLTADIPQIMLYKEVVAWDGRILESERLDVRCE